MILPLHTYKYNTAFVSHQKPVLIHLHKTTVAHTYLHVSSPGDVVHCTFKCRIIILSNNYNWSCPASPLLHICSQLNGLCQCDKLADKQQQPTVIRMNNALYEHLRAQYAPSTWYDFCKDTNIKVKHWHKVLQTTVKCYCHLSLPITFVAIFFSYNKTNQMH